MDMTIRLTLLEYSILNYLFKKYGVNHYETVEERLDKLLDLITRDDIYRFYNVDYDFAMSLLNFIDEREEAE